jgi:cytochrome c5
MSDPQDIHAGQHESPIRTPQQLITTVVLAFVVPVLAIIAMVNYVAMGTKPAAGTRALDAESVAKRIMPVATVVLKDASNPGVAKTGEQVYQAQCSACHAAGVAGAPKFGDAAAWGPRIATGFDALWNSALKGKGAMPPQAGGDHSDFEIARAVVYMANQGGAKFDEPKAPAGAASAASGAAPATEAASAPAPAPAAAAVAPAPVAAAAPAADGARVEASAGLVKLFFASGKAELPPDAKAALGKLADEIKAGAKMAVISGYHDATGSAAKNAELAKQRAVGARDLLVAAGVPKDRITLQKPVSTKGGEDAAQARRVEIAVK